MYPNWFPFHPNSRLRASRTGVHTRPRIWGVAYVLKFWCCFECYCLSYDLMLIRFHEWFFVYVRCYRLRIDVNISWCQRFHAVAKEFPRTLRTFCISTYLDPCRIICFAFRHFVTCSLPVGSKCHWTLMHSEDTTKHLYMCHVVVFVQLILPLTKCFSASKYDFCMWLMCDSEGCMWPFRAQFVLVFTIQSCILGLAFHNHIFLCLIKHVSPQPVNIVWWFWWILAYIHFTLAINMKSAKKQNVWRFNCAILLIWTCNGSVFIQGSIYILLNHRFWVCMIRTNYSWCAAMALGAASIPKRLSRRSAQWAAKQCHELRGTEAAGCCWVEVLTASLGTTAPLVVGTYQHCCERWFTLYSSRSSVVIVCQS